MPRRRDEPPHLRSLKDRIAQESRVTGQPIQRLTDIILATAVCQMMPPGVVKGGNALTLRAGPTGSRFSGDLDVSRQADAQLSDWVEHFETRLREGWGAFAGLLIEHEPADPPGVPDDYVMRPFRVMVTYANSDWQGVAFELGVDEIGSTATPQLRLSPEVAQLFATLGLPAPDPVPVMAAEHQIVQKIHACTAWDGKSNERAHDLVDLQLLFKVETVDLARVGTLARQLFRFRKQNRTWPPPLQVRPGWEDLYQAAAEDLPVLPDVYQAVAWLDDIIRQAEAAADS
jgi:hypothetical protein